MPYEIGQEFGQLRVLSFYQFDNGKRTVRMARCQCSCGEIVDVEKYNLGGNSTRCKTCAVASRSKKKRTHVSSMSFAEDNPLGYSCYTRWQAMKRRCYTPSERSYPGYGGRGIRVCDRWRDSYENFVADMGLPPTKDHQIDRIDNDGHYEPSNCRWVTREENGRNKRNNSLISAFGHTMTLSEWAQKTGLKRETIARRIEKGAHPEDALDEKIRKPGNTKRIDTPYGLFETISDCSRATGLSVSTIHGRLKSERKPEWYVVA